MMMQHDKLDGMPIAIDHGERFEERMRRIKTDLLQAATLRARDDSPWFAIRVMSGREIVVKNVLDEAGIEALVPMRKGPEYRRRGRVVPSKMIPVMTSYVLVRFMPSDEAFLGIQGVEHVIGVLGGCINPRRIWHSARIYAAAECPIRRLTYSRPWRMKVRSIGSVRREFSRLVKRCM